MARTFDGAGDYISAAPGALNGVGGGAITIAAIIKISDLAGSGSVVYCGDGDVAGVDLELFGGEFYLSSQGPPLAAGSTADNWTLIAATKAAGTVTPRYHKHVYDTGAWTHTDAGGTMPNGVAAGGSSTTQFGRWGSASSRFAGDIAVAGVWARQLTDTEIEQLAYTLQAWYAAAPVAGWTFDQADVSQNVCDWTGGGANQTAIDSTSIAASSVPGLSYSFETFTQAETAGGTDATVPASTVAATTAVGAATVATGSTVAPASIVATLTMAAATVSTGTTPTPATTAATTTISTPAITTGSTVSPATLAAVATIGSPTTSGGASPTPATIAAAATISTPAVSTGTTLTPATITAITAMAAATVNSPTPGIVLRPDLGLVIRPDIGLVLRP